MVRIVLWRVRTCKSPTVPAVGLTTLVSSPKETLRGKLNARDIADQAIRLLVAGSRQGLHRHHGVDGGTPAPRRAHLRAVGQARRHPRDRRRSAPARR